MPELPRDLDALLRDKINTCRIDSETADEALELLATAIRRGAPAVLVVDLPFGRVHTVVQHSKREALAIIAHLLTHLDEHWGSDD